MLRMNEWNIVYPDLPECLEGLSIVQLSDLHFANCYDRRYFERVVDACTDWAADLVVVTGDLIEHDDTIAWIEPLLGRLESRLGKFAILGNHDVRASARASARCAGRGGIRVAGRLRAFLI